MIIDRVLRATIALKEYPFPMSSSVFPLLCFVVLLYYYCSPVIRVLSCASIASLPPILLLIMVVDDDTDRDIVFSVSRQRQFPVIFLCWCFNRFCKCIYIYICIMYIVRSIKKEIHVMEFEK